MYVHMCLFASSTMNNNRHSRRFNASSLGWGWQGWETSGGNPQANAPQFPTNGFGALHTETERPNTLCVCVITCIYSYKLLHIFIYIHIYIYI